MTNEAIDGLHPTPLQLPPDICNKPPSSDVPWAEILESRAGCLLEATSTTYLKESNSVQHGYLTICKSLKPS